MKVDCFLHLDPYRHVSVTKRYPRTDRAGVIIKLLLDVPDSVMNPFFTQAIMVPEEHMEVHVETQPPEDRTVDETYLYGPASEEPPGVSVRDEG